VVLRGGAAVWGRVVVVVIKRIPFGGDRKIGYAKISAGRRHGNAHVQDNGAIRAPAFTTLVLASLYAWTWT
jgi:hypothetical protein